MARALGLAAGFVADRAFGDPTRWHPVAGFGGLAQAVERRTYADDHARGVAHSIALVGGTTVAGLLVERVARGSAATRFAVTAVSTWAVLGGRSLAREADHVRSWLDADDLPAAREQLTHLVGRDPSTLDESGVARATIESVAENTSDAVVAPLLWGAVAGVPGLVGYRAANTLDAMVGHRSPRYERFGWASARLDDALNLAPARLAAGLAAALAPVVGGSGRAAARTWRRDASHHPSPNAGPVEASFAGALGVRLGGVNVYAGRAEDRHELGDGPPPTTRDIARAVRLADAVGVGALAVGVVIARRPRRAPRRGR